MHTPTLVILAAGMGSRYGGPKQIEPVGPYGELLLDYSIYDALQSGFGRMVFVIRKELEAGFRSAIGQRIERHCEVGYAFQRLDVPLGYKMPVAREKPWGTAHAILSCSGLIDTPFAAINADDFYGRSAFRALCDYLKSAEDRDGVYDYCMVGYVLKNTLSQHGHVARGLCMVNEEGYLVGIDERTRIARTGEAIMYTEDGESWVEVAAETPVSMNMWGFTPSLFAELEARFPVFLRSNAHNLLKAEFFLPKIVGDLVSGQRATVKVLPTDEEWLGITYPEDRRRAQRGIVHLIREGVYPENLWQR